MTTPLATPQYSAVRATSYAGERLLTLFSGRVVFAGQVNSDLSTGEWLQFNYNNVTVGAYTDVIADQVLIISASNDIATGSYFRVYAAPTSSIMYTNDSSTNYAVGAYFWVLDLYMPDYRLSKPGTDGSELVDGRLPYQGQLPLIIGLQTGYADYVNAATGKLRLAFDVSATIAQEPGAGITSILYNFPSGTVVGGSLSAAIVVVDFDYGELWGHCTATDSGGRTLTRHFGIKALDPLLYPADTGFEGATLTETLDQGATLTVPAFGGVDDVLTNAFAILFRADEQTDGLSAVPFGGGTASVTSSALTSNLVTLTAVGHSLQVGQTVVVADVGGPYDGTWTITFTTSNTFSYGLNHANIGSAGCAGLAVVNPANVDFVGWFQKEDDTIAVDAKYSVLSTASFQFTGFGPRLSRLTAQELAIVYSASPTRWGDLKGATPWRAIGHFLTRYTTIANLCDVTFDDTGTTYTFGEMSTQGGNAFAAVKGIADQINAVIEFAPAGGLAINKDVNYLSAFNRALVPVVANWQAQDAVATSGQTAIARQIDPMASVGKVDANGSYWNTTLGQATKVFTSRAPGVAYGPASGTDTLPNQILAAGTNDNTARDELLARAGYRFDYANASEFLDVTHFDGVAAARLTPARSQVYTWTLTDVAGPNGVNRVNYGLTILWTLESLTTTGSSERGTIEVKARYRRVPGVSGPGDDTTVTIVAPNSVPDPLPDWGLPAFNYDLPELYFPDSGLLPTQIAPAQLLPPPGKALTANGGELIVWDATDAWFLKNYIALTTPVPNLITPDDLGAYQIKQIIADPFSNFTTAVGAFLLASDGTNSAVWHSASVVAPVPSWTKGAAVAGVYQTIRATKTAGAVMIYAPSRPGLWTKTWDFTSSDGGFTAVIGGDGNPRATYVGGTGWESVYNVGGLGIEEVRITHSLSASSVFTSATATYTALQTLSANQEQTFVDGTASVSPNSYPAGTGKTFTVSIPSLTGSATFRIDAANAVSNNTRIILTALSVSGSGSNPFGGGSGGAAVALSLDQGATFQTPVDVGTTPGTVGGFDVQRAGSVSYAAAAGAVLKATTLGGAYSSWYSVPGAANPVCIIIPYFRRNSTTVNTSTSTPDVIIACDSGKLYWIDGTAATATDITPPGVTAFDNPNCVTVSYGHHLAVFASVSGTYHLFTSTNGGTSWVDRGARTAPTFIRCRRNDTRAVTSGTNKGQTFMADNGSSYYSSVWDSTGPYIRNMPAAILGVETIF